MVVMMLVSGAQAQEGQGFDKSKAGVTSSGIAFIADEWVKLSGYGQPAFLGGPTGWQKKPMKLNTAGYWEVNIGKSVNGAILFCFEMDFADIYIPHLLVDSGKLSSADGITINSVVDNKKGGYNFYATPVAKAPWER